MQKQECMWSSIEGISNFIVKDRVENDIDNGYNLFRELVKIEDRWIRIQTYCMKLVTILYKECDTLTMF